jgi:membrane protease YdiL (CAAX protease family)
VVGGFLEEMTFRGYLITQIKKHCCGDSFGAVIALIITSASFGLSHLYQGATGVLSTGLIGFILGVIYIKNRYNLWLPIFTHGFVNTAGFILIYLNLDLRLKGLLW